MLKPHIYACSYFIAISCIMNTYINAHAKTSARTTTTIKRLENQDNQKSAEYLQSIKQKLEHYWYPARGANAHATVIFRINKNGGTSWVEVTSTSSEAAVNASAENAVYTCSPFPAPLASSFIDIAADFKSNYCPEFHSVYTRPATGDLENSYKLYSSAINAKNAGNLENALNLMQQANQTLPQNVRIRDSLIDLLCERAKSAPKDQAMSMLREALLLDPYNQSTRHHLNTALKSSGKDPDDYDMRLAQAQDCEHNFLFDEALCEYGEAWLLKQDINLIPEINLACQRRANYSEVRKWQEALKVADNAQYHTQLAHAYESCGELKNAEVEYHLALKLNPFDQQATSGLDRLQSVSQLDSSKLKVGEAVELRDDFPYTKIGQCTVSVTVVKNRKWTSSVDYLVQACGKNITRWANTQTSFRLYVDDGRNVPGYHPEYRQAMIDAFAEWVKASDNQLSYKVVNSPQQANISCYWVSNRIPEMKENEIGITKYRFVNCTNGANLMEGAQVYILTLTKNKQYESVPCSVMRAVCLHELGHTLGITGHSPYKGDVMYPSVSPYYIPKELSERDIATIQRLYEIYDQPQQK